MTGAGAPGGPGIARALHQLPEWEIWLGDTDDYASGRALYPDNFVVLPKADEENFIPFVLDFCISNRIQVIVPLVTRELFHFSAAADKFKKAGIKVVVSPLESLSVANNKSRLHLHLQKNGVEVAAFKTVLDIANLKTAAAELGYPSRPVCIKPAVSNGSRGFRILDENYERFKAFFHAKPDNTYSDLDTVTAILKTGNIPEMLVMEYLPGEEYTVDCLIYEGKPLLILPRKRIQMNNGISVKGQFVNQPEIIRYCEKILQCLPLEGPIGIQVKANEKGEFRLLEINPRLQGTTVAALGLGINLPALAVYAALGQPHLLTIPDIKWGLRFARYYNEVFFQDQDLNPF